MKLTRREAIGMMGAAAISTQFAGSAFAAEAKSTKGIAMQLYTMRDPAKEDLPGTLKKVREIGFEYVQWSGMPDLPADKIRAELDAAGLKAIACHTSVEQFEKDLDGAVAFWKTVGVDFAGPGGMMGDCQESLEAWLRGVKRLDAVGAKMREKGIRLTYHNHAGEFEKFEGDDRCKLDILFAEAKPENVFAELDLAWVKVGGADPAAYIRKYAKRCPTVHAKDLTADSGKGKVKFTPLGKGSLDWTDIFVAGKEAGIEWYIYEQDDTGGDPFGCAKTSFDFLAKNLL
ncbi:MAG: sugar phosphate isomerase/epimerase [Candidatus Hydrogenedentales bacterium]